MYKQGKNGFNLRLSNCTKVFSNNHIPYEINWEKHEVLVASKYIYYSIARSWVELNPYKVGRKLPPKAFLKEVGLL